MFRSADQRPRDAPAIKGIAFTKPGTPPIGLVIDETQKIQRLYRTAKFLESTCKPCRAIVGLECARQTCGMDDPEF